MKISQQDLEEIFNDSDNKIIPEEKGESVLIKKVRKTNDIKRIRHSIKQIRTDKTRREINSEFINSILRFLAIAGFSGFVIFIAMSWNGLMQQLKWGYFVDFKGEKPPTSQTVVVLASPTPKRTPIPVASSVPVDAPSNLPVLQANFENNSLKIEKIDVRAPIAWEIEEDNILEALIGGVAQYKGTSLPGKGGNVFIVGHSSNYFWVKSDYNNIFALLDKLTPGDRIEVSKDDKNYIYEVKETKVVAPNDVQVLENTTKETLTLMTCWPIGTSLKRMLVQSELVYSYSAN
jgi:sortase A